MTSPYLLRLTRPLAQACREARGERGKQHLPCRACPVHDLCRAPDSHRWLEMWASTLVHHAPGDTISGIKPVAVQG